MTAMNTLTPYQLVGGQPWAFGNYGYLGMEDCAEFRGGPTAARILERKANPRIVIQWRDLTAESGGRPMAPGQFWEKHSLDQLAAAQGIAGTFGVAAIQGAWPPEEIDDGFDIALAKWRKQGEARHR